MDILTLEKIKKASSEALRGRKRLEKLHNSYIAKWNAGTASRSATTTYNANTHDIMQNIVTPNENIIKDIFLERGCDL